MPMLSLDAITVDDRFQIRERQSTDMIARYTESIEAGANMPPLVLWVDGGVNYLIDGFHRFRAYESAGIRQVQVEIFHGTRHQAIQRAVSANLAHGLGMGQRDMRRAGRMLLAQARALGMSINQSEYATRFGVSRTTISRWLEQLDGVGGSSEPEPPAIDDDIPDLDAIPERPEPKPAAVLADDPIDTVPDRKVVGSAKLVVEVAEGQAQFESLMRTMSKVNSGIKALADEPAGAAIGREIARVDEAYRTIHEILSAATPHALCVFCGGDRCQKCSRRGWMTKDEHRNAEI